MGFFRDIERKEGIRFLFESSQIYDWGWGWDWDWLVSFIGSDGLWIL